MRPVFFASPGVHRREGAVIRLNEPAFPNAALTRV